MATPKPLFLLCITLLCLSFSYSQWTQTLGPEGGYTDDIVKIENTLILSAGGGGVYISTNNGASWESSNEGLPLHPHVHRIASNGGNVYISLYQAGVYRSMDKGSTWSPANNGVDRLTFYSLFANGEEIYVGSADRTVYYSPDQGASWFEKSNGISGYHINGFVSFNSKMYAGTTGGLFESVDNGDIWNEINIPGLSPNGIQSITEYNGVFYATSDGQMFASNDNLASWVLTPLGSGSTLTKVVGYEGVVYTANSLGRYYYSSDNGVNWTLVQNTNTNSSTNNILLSNNKLIMSTNEGIFESFDDGFSWNLNNNGIKAQTITALASTDTYIFAAAAENGIFRSSDNGASWTQFYIDTANLNTKTINDIVVIGNIIYASTYVGIYMSNDNGNNWVKKLDPGLNKATAGMDYSNGILAVSLEGDGVYLSADMGETWTLTPTAGLNPETGFKNLLIREQAIVGSTVNGALYASADLGQTWSNISIPNGFYYIQDLEFKDNRLYAATGQGVLASDDFGENWYRFLTYGYNSIQDIIVIDNTIYAATDFGVYASEAGRDFWYPFTEGTKNEYLNEILLKDGTLFAGTSGSSIWSRPISEITVPPLDDDNDGVVNDDDLCAGTPWGSEVDSHGCSASQLDDDNDGVTNDIDLCVDTPIDAEVDSNGCAASQLDDDNDGVTNDIDLCIDTPADAVVDSNGCADSQLDDDNDGVTNEIDLCVDTPADAIVDSNGCAASQLDDDNDGVTNDIDLCIDTPADAVVDSNGCADSQLDDDNDGVTNDIDLCQDTPADEVVDSNGCAASQLDDDNDGVTNDIDICADTPANEDVNDHGCSASQLDDDNDGVTNDIDLCLNTYPGITVNAKGCDLIASNSISVYSETPTCPNSNNGSIQISTSLSGYSFDIHIVGEGRDENYTAINLNSSLKVAQLDPGNYEITVAIPAIFHEQLFGATIYEINNISGKFESADSNTKTAKYTVSGSKEYLVDINGIEKKYIFDSTDKKEIVLHNLKMSNEIVISGKSDCQGKLTDSFTIGEEILIFPTITSGLVSISGDFKPAEIRIYNSSGQLIYNERMNTTIDNTLHLDNYTSGLYIIHVLTEGETKSFKIIKR